MDFYERLHKGIVLFDGAMGTQIQGATLTETDWQGKNGCNEILNLTAPAVIREIHEKYFAAGADVVETNTFGANVIVLAEYGLENQVVEINRQAARIAREAADKYALDKPRFVAGSLGPGTKLITLGQTDFDTLYHSYALQAEGLLQGGVDLFIIETCQDLLQIKTCLLAVKDIMHRFGKKLPLLVSVTVETTGTLLVGSELGAVLAALEPFEIDVLGMNCATGPDQMHPYIKQLVTGFKGPVICQPNAGLPQNVGGQMTYTLSVSQFVEVLSGFVKNEGVQLVGGCCGTTPEYIQALGERLKSITLPPRRLETEAQVASLFSAKSLHQVPAPFFIGERTNTNGSRLFKDYLLAANWDGIVDMGRQQENSGAHGLDLCVAYTGRDETADMTEAVRRLRTQINLPLFIDSTNEKVIEAALKLYGGRAVINSVNLESGEPRAHTICALAKRYGTALIALLIDEQGMAMDIERKREVARRIYHIAVTEHGLRPEDLIFDTLTFTLGSGDETLKTAGINTLEAIRQIKAELPGVLTLLGVSNISFGLNAYSREVLNSVFLAEAVKAGLDLAIVNVTKIMPLYQIADEDQEVCLNLIYNRTEASADGNPLFAFIKHFEQKEGRVSQSTVTEEALSLEEKIKQRIIQGSKLKLEELLHESLKEKKAEEIINTILIPAMKVVGELFGDGKMQLPFVLQSAETMKFAVDKLEPFMEKKSSQVQKSIILATVRGDVHDIGKNLVDIILSNNGYKVYNLGIKCEIATMLDKAREVGADILGMSGLLVKSTVVMKENLEEMRLQGIDIPVLLGGAALTRDYVQDVCAPLLEAPVIYCRDAFEGLQCMELLKNGRLDEKAREQAEKSAPRPVSAGPVTETKNSETVVHDINIPEVPFWGDRVVTRIGLDEVFPYLTEEVLYRGRWGYRRGKLSKEEYEELINQHARPALENLKQRCREERLLEPQVVYGYYPCQSEGEDIIVYPHPDKTADAGSAIRFHFPRQQKPPYRCLADFFLPVSSGRMDIIALQVVTVGARASEETKHLYETNAYKDYLLLHGLSVEMAEALAEYWHLKIRQELKITEQDGSGINDYVMQKYRGSRYSFGYPACPDLAENKKIFQLLKPERIGVTITDGEQMVPEQSTSAFIVHHPQAKYFTIT